MARNSFAKHSRSASRHPGDRTLATEPRPDAREKDGALVWPKNRAIAIALLGTALALAVAANTGPIGNNDYGLHQRIGREIVESWRPPQIDNHSHTFRNAPYPDHEWLTQAVYYLLHRAVGIGGMVALKGLLIGLALGLMVASARGPLILRLGLVALVISLTFDYSHMRPHLISWVMAGLLNVLLFRGTKWGVVLLLLVWGNCHGSVLLGVGIAGLFFLEEYWRRRDGRLLLWAAACAAAPLLNPNGIGIYTIFFEIKGHTGFIGEWEAYKFENRGFWIVCAIVALAIVGWIRARPLNPFDAVRVAVLAFLAFQSSRNGVIASIFLAPMLGRWHGDAVSRLKPRAAIAISVVMIAVMAAAVVVRERGGRALRFEVDHEQLPVYATTFIREQGLKGPMFNDYNFGGYLLWKAWPDLPVFIDGRTEVYRGPVLETYLRVINGAPDWEVILRRYEIAFCVVRPNRPVARLLLSSAEWDLVYFDYNSVIFVRSGLFPELRRLRAFSPYGPREGSRPDEIMDEVRYVLGHNPLFFGGHKVLAFLLYRSGDYAGARESLQRYLELHPAGLKIAETQSLIDGLRDK
jgi:hypothetical protein